MARRRPIVLDDDDDAPTLSTKRPRVSSPQEQEKVKVKSSISVDKIYNFFFDAPGTVKGINSVKFPSRETFLEVCSALTLVYPWHAGLLCC
jgi:hypothetical protein